MNAYHEANRVRWQACAATWARKHGEYWKRAYSDPSLVLLPEELELLGDVRGKNICVLGSGDNNVVFAFAGMGANATSVDISSNQLDTAKQRAELLGAKVRFVCNDVTELKDLAGNSFDIVYTGGHVAVWVSNLFKYYAEATRILKPSGLFLVDEYHPFRRLWKEAEKLEMHVGYFERGPHEYDAVENVLDRTPGSLKQYEFHWTVSEFIRAVMENGNELLTVLEIGDEPEGWEASPLKGLPQRLIIAARKLESPRDLPMKGFHTRPNPRIPEGG
ncbi:MAG TPA: class I SAM-dependent methyltransferase [Planctomycetota bacterium]|nr:class I SAM-dependent methyltransferase [Planctomycetota bacterium]